MVARFNIWQPGGWAMEVVLPDVDEDEASEWDNEERTERIKTAYFTQPIGSGEDID